MIDFSMITVEETGPDWDGEPPFYAQLHGDRGGPFAFAQTREDALAALFNYLREGQS